MRVRCYYRAMLFSCILPYLLSCSSSVTTDGMYHRFMKDRSISGFRKSRQYEVNSYVPDFKLKGENRLRFNLSTYKGKWILLYFWTAESQWSISGLSTMTTIQKTFQDDLQVICMECYTDRSDRDTVLSNDMPCEIILCKCNVKSAIFKYFRIKSFPTRILIGPTGKVIEMDEGSVSDNFPLVIESYMNRQKKQTVIKMY